MRTVAQIYRTYVTSFVPHRDGNDNLFETACEPCTMHDVVGFEIDGVRRVPFGTGEVRLGLTGRYEVQDDGSGGESGTWPGWILAASAPAVERRAGEENFLRR